MRNEGLDRRFGGSSAAMVMAGLFLAGIMTVSCADDEAAAPLQEADSLKAVVEGLVLPANAKATVTLSRGDTVLSAVTRDGYFQAAGIDYGMYIMDVKAPGHGGARSMVIISAKRVYLEERLQENVPWPVSRISPSDSLVFVSNRQDSTVQVVSARYMDRASVEKAFRIDPPSKFRLEWNPRVQAEDLLGDILSITFFPADLDFGKSYRVTLDSSAATEDGDRLEDTLRYTVRRAVSNTGRDVLGYFLNGIFAGPADTISISFPRAMDEASIMGRIVLDPVGLPRWIEPRRDTPEPDPGNPVEARQRIGCEILGGYRAQDGTEGGPFSGTFVFDGFGVMSPDAGSQNVVEDGLEMTFNLPVDLASLKFKDGFRSVRGSGPRGSAADPVDLPGARDGDPPYLRVDALHSVHGDTLSSPFHVKVLRDAPATAFRFLDSSQASEGLGPVQDTLRLTATWSAYQRLRSAALSVTPLLSLHRPVERLPSEQAHAGDFQNPVPRTRPSSYSLLPEPCPGTCCPSPPPRCSQRPAAFLRRDPGPGRGARVHRVEIPRSTPWVSPPGYPSNPPVDTLCGWSMTPAEHRTPDHNPP